VSALALQSGHTLNSATFGIDFPTPAGQKPFFDPNGEIIGPINLLDIRGRVTVPAIDFAARQRVSGSRLALKASEAEAESAGEQAAATAATAYLRAVRADAIVEARAADSLLADSLITIARDQLSAGVGVALDVTRAQSQLAGVHAQLIAARGEQSRSRLELVRAIGAPLDAPVTLASPLAAMPVSDTVPAQAEAVAVALRTRPDLVAAQRALDAARQGARAIRAERLPSLAAFGDDGGIGTSPSHLLNTYSWGIQLSVPILDGFRREGRISEQDAKSAGLELQRRELERQVAVEVRSALLDLATAARSGRGGTLSACGSHSRNTRRRRIDSERESRATAMSSPLRLRSTEHAISSSTHSHRISPRESSLPGRRVLLPRSPNAKTNNSTQSIKRYWQWQRQ
jgi:hypothetical protein